MRCRTCVNLLAANQTLREQVTILGAEVHRRGKLIDRLRHKLEARQRETRPERRRDGHGPIQMIVRRGGYVMVKRPRSRPFVMDKKKWEGLR